MLVWLEFIVCAVVITVVGAKLSHYGDVIADKTKLGGTWIGLAMLATVTSLPELVTGVTSVSVANAPEIAVGDILGSCVFNLLIIVALDFMFRTESVYSRASQGHILAGAFGIMLIGFAGFNISIASDGRVFSIGHVGLYAPVIFLLYLISMRTVFLYERRTIAAFAGEVADRYPGITLRQAVIGYAIAALIVVAAGIAMPFVAKGIATEMGWSEGFVGTLFVAFATSLPEVVVTLAALRLGAVDMAVGNLFGSNLFNIFILVIDDIFYLEGPLLYHVDSSHVISALSAIMMTGAAIAGLLYRPATRVYKTVGWTSIFLFTLYSLNALMLYLYSVP